MIELKENDLLLTKVIGEGNYAHGNDDCMLENEGKPVPFIRHSEFCTGALDVRLSAHSGAYVYDPSEIEGKLVQRDFKEGDRVRVKANANELPDPHMVNFTLDMTQFLGKETKIVAIYSVYVLAVSENGARCDYDLNWLEPIYDVLDLETGNKVGEYSDLLGFVRTGEEPVSHEQDVANQLEKLAANYAMLAPVTLTDTQRESLIKEMYDLLKEYGHYPDKDAVGKIVDTWFAQKEPIIRLLAQHPNWNPDKFMIQFDHTYERVLDLNERNNFFDYIEYTVEFFDSILVENTINGKSYSEVEDEATRAINNLDVNSPHYENGVCTNLEDMVDLYRKKLQAIALYRQFRDVGQFSQESQEKKQRLKDIFRVLRGINTRYIEDQDVVDRLNELDGELRVHKGAKTNKIVHKFFRMYSADKHSEYGSRYARYADAMNPLSIVRHTLLSVNPIDYLTMSFGHKWSSCHTIDGGNIRSSSDDGYHGMYMSGCVSYLLDPSSIVYYTVDKDYDGKDFELQDKITRQMFHWGEAKLVQGRYYPYDQTDRGRSVTNDEYAPVREIVQKIFTQCLGIDNLWLIRKGTTACGEATEKYGTHYPDITHYDNCNVSYIKPFERVTRHRECNTRSFVVGHRPICVSCGRSHNFDGKLSCCEGNRNIKFCHHCGDEIDIDDDYFRQDYEGNYYCDDDDCAYYCNGYERYVDASEDYDYVHGDRYSLDYLENSNRFAQCYDCGDWYYVDDMILDKDGDVWCEHCANNNLTYVPSEGEYYPNDYVTYCEVCGEAILKENANTDDDGNYYCDDCYEELENEE